MNYTISEINLSRKSGRRAFIQVPFNLHHDNPNWVPPLRLSVDELLNPAHPFHETAKVKAWTIGHKEKVLGRIMAIINHRYNEFHSYDYGFFGFFECANDSAAAKKLFSTALEYLKANGCKQVLGPVNPSTNYECGLLVEGFDDPPQIMMTQNPPYYSSMIEEQGFDKAKDLFAYHFDLNKGLPEIIKRVSERIEKSQNLKFRPIDKKHFERDIKLIHQVYNEAWEKNWGFVPMTDKEFFHMGKELKQIVIPELALIAEVNGEPAGFILTLPDLNQILKKVRTGKLFPFGLFQLIFGIKKIDRARTLTMGVREKFRKKGIESAFYYKSWEATRAMNYKEVEMSWILEDNEAMNRPIKKVDATKYKTYRIYKKDI